MEDCNFNAKAMRRIYEEKHRPEIEKRKLEIENQKKEIIKSIKVKAEVGQCVILLSNLYDENIKFLLEQKFDVWELYRNSYKITW